MAKLGDVCEVLDKLRKPITKKHRTSGNVPYYGATGIVDWVADYIFNEKLILVGEDGAKWKRGEKTAFIVDGKTWVNNHAHVLRPTESVVMHEWISYYLTGSDLSPWVTGLTVPKLNQEQLRSIPIPLPPLAEQKRIVTKLDAAFAEIDKAFALAETKEAEFQKLKSRMLSAFLHSKNETAWETVTLKGIIEKTENVNPSEKFPSDEFEYIDVSSVNRKSFSIEKTQTLLGVEAPSRARRRVRYKDLIFATVRPTLRRVALIPNELDGQICSTGYIVLRPKKDMVLSSYLFYFMVSDFVLNAMENLQSGASYPAVTDVQVKSLKISFPPIAEQKRIVEKLDATFEEIDKATNAKAQTRANYQALKSATLAQELQSGAA